MNTENQLFNLSMICQRNLENDKFSNYVYFAVSRHIRTGRATRDFEKRFNSLQPDQLENLMNYCLDAGLSDDEIMKRCKTFLSKSIDKRINT